MLRTTSVDPSVIDLVVAGRNSNINGVDNSKIDRAKIGAKAAKSKSEDKNKGKNLVKVLL